MWKRCACSLPLLVLDLGLDVVNGIGRLHLEGNGFASEGLYEDLHGNSSDSNEESLVDSTSNMIVSM